MTPETSEPEVPELDPQLGELTTRREHAQAVADRMVRRALWMINLESNAEVSDATKQTLLDETTDMLMKWAYEVGEESFRAGDFSSRPGAAGQKEFPERPAKAGPKRLGQNPA